MDMRYFDNSYLKLNYLGNDYIFSRSVEIEVHQICLNNSQENNKER